MARVFAAASGVVVEELVDELCLMRLDTQDVLVLNQTATDVWLLITDGLSSTEVIDRLAQSYAVPATDIAPHVLDVIELMESRGFLVNQPGAEHNS